MIFILLLYPTTQAKDKGISDNTTIDITEMEQFDVIIPYDNVSLVDGIISVDEYSHFYYDSVSQITAFWEHSDENLIVGLVSPGTGWVALGIGDAMFNSTMIIGGFDNTAYCFDYVGLSNWNHVQDTIQGGSNDIIKYNATEDTNTTLEFVIPLNTEDQLDPILEINQTYSMFLAYQASSDDMTTVHTSHSNIFSVYLKPEQIIDFIGSTETLSDIDLTDGDIETGWNDIHDYQDVAEFGSSGLAKFSNNDTHIFALFTTSIDIEWIAIEFDADSDCMQSNNDGWTFYINSSGGVQAVDSYYTGLTNPSTDGKNDLHYESLVSDSIVQIEIVRAINSTDLVGHDIVFSNELISLRFASNQNHYSNIRIYTLSLDLIEQTTQTTPPTSSSETTTNTETTSTTEGSTNTSTDLGGDDGKLITFIAIAAISTLGLVGVGFVSRYIRSRRFDKALGELEDSFKLGEQKKEGKE
ncbi:MAG: DOMON domain-containing protein [Candidatus Kariarchaeaceae archaeon]